ncbi:MAG TPA: serine O-acetyltransferase EpsC [Polyangiales bacterium]
MSTQQVALRAHDGAAELDVNANLGNVVASLRAAREARRCDDSAARRRLPLPSRDAIEDVVSGLRSALFPTHFGAHELADLTDASVDYFVGHTLATALRILQEQTRRTLAYETPALADDRQELDRRAARLSRQFAERLPVVRSLLEGDIRAAYDGDPAAKSRAEVMFCYPGIQAIIHHRLAHELYNLGLTLLARIISESAHAATGIDIHPGAQIGERFFIDHGTGVVIGETTVIGNGVRLYQGVTLGAKSFPTDATGAVIKGQPRHPIIEDDVIIYSGATVLGRITVGRGSSIGGNVWLTRSLPPKSLLTQARAHSETFDDGAGI